VWRQADGLESPSSSDNPKEIRHSLRIGATGNDEEGAWRRWLTFSTCWAV
jgi:hypothetical protein